MKKNLDYHALQVLLTEYKIDLFRYDAYVRSVVLRNLLTAQKEILAKIAGEDLASLRKREVEKLLKSIEQIIDDEYERIEKFMARSGKEFFITTHQAEAFMYNEWLGAGLFQSLPKYKLESIKHTPLFEGRPLADWWNKQSRDLKFNIETTIRNGALIGETEYTVARQIRDRFNVVGYHAETLVRTGNSSIANQAQSKLVELNSDILYAKQHLSTLDGRTSPICRHRDGMRWKVDGTPIGHKEPFIEPPLHPNCRSIIIMVLDRNNTSFRASEFGVVDGSINYAAWFKEQTTTYQNKILGEKRAEWVRTGKAYFNKMLNQNDRPLTIEQLKKKYKLT